MSEAPRLYELQTIDLEIEEKERRLAEVEASLGESEALLQARARLQEAQATVAQQETQLRDTDMELGNQADKTKQAEEKLYGGTVRSPRELGSLEQDVRALRAQRSVLEDRELEMMVQLDDSRAALRDRQAEYAAAEATWRQEQARWEEERAALLDRLAVLRSQRERLAGGLPSASLTTYEDLRKTKRGRAVARVEQNICQGCRITLPSQEVQRARSSPSLVFCSSCGRILCVSR
ncbi:MAG: C4-type zinc ribbon domain-containing protein [Bacteroidetes bacterium]|nr:C4-type zinc ribbon domain-containing protein [Bacteroidota bacterium]MCL5025777.1 C4-type zinc ribbon domain-containing protein [Chloroflexota bacterium]